MYKELNDSNMTKEHIEKSKYYEVFSTDFEENINFLIRFSELFWINGYAITFIAEDQSIHFISTSIIDNSIQTLKSIRLCCTTGNFADANTLLRKLRDDLLLYVFILDVIKNRNPFKSKGLDNINVANKDEFVNSFLSLKLNMEFSDNEKAISAWLRNKVTEQPKLIKERLSYDNYMKTLKQNNLIQKILKDYELEKYWGILRVKLNNYVHNNGHQFTLDNLVMLNNPNLETYLQSINYRSSYIISFFLILIIITDSKLISSTEYMDHLNLGLDPPEGCQYNIASFIQNYLDKKVVKLHPEIKQYLKDNNLYGMRID